MPQDIYYRRHLPHIHPEGHPLFITFNLADSIPLNIWLELKQQREQELKNATPEQRYLIQKNSLGNTMNGSTVPNMAAIGWRRKMSPKSLRTKSAAWMESVTACWHIALCPTIRIC